MTVDTVTQTLQQAFSPVYLNIVDDSWQHAGHSAMAHTAMTAQASHLSITLVSASFKGVNRLDRHRMVHKALKAAFDTHLHALVLKPYTPEEWPDLKQTF